MAPTKARNRSALGPGDLLLAAEAPLLQHQSADGISLMRRRPGEEIRSAGALDVGATGRYDGLTELLALPTRQLLLGLRRGFEPPDNWEAMALGPALSDGRQTLVLASDDNFNPLQSSWLAVLTPRRTTACTD